MASRNKNLSSYREFTTAHSVKYKVGIVVSEYNEEITFSMMAAVIDTLKQYGVKEKNIFTEFVPGAFELPLAAKWLQSAKKLHAVICLGCVIKGDTDHDIYINRAVSEAVMNLSLQTGIPFIFGLLTPNTLQQAKDRSGGKLGNKGVECAVAALKMLIMKDDLNKRK